MRTRLAILTAGLVVLAATPTPAQFRRGLLAESTEIALSPNQPAGDPAAARRGRGPGPQQQHRSARLVDRVRDLFGQQLTDNDSRLSVASQGATSSSSRR